MSTFSPTPLRTLEDIVRFEQETPFVQRIPARSVFDLFAASAERYPARIALTMVMTGADDEQPRRVSYREFLGLIRRAANMFSAIAGQRPGVAYMLPSLVETHLTLWGAETVGFAVPINFLLQAEHVADLLKASGASVLVALGPHPQLDIWEKALRVRQMLPHLQLVRVGPPSLPSVEGVVDFQQTLMTQPDDRLSFGEPGRDEDVAAYFHTGGTTGAPKLVAHSHRNQIVSAFGGSVLMHMAETDVFGCGLPLFHVAGTIFCGLSCFMTGAEAVILSPGGYRNPIMINRYWHLIEKYKLTWAGGVPTVVAGILEVPIEGADLSCVRLGICGAASTPRAVVERFERLTGKPMHEVLGMTESAGLTCIDPAYGERAIGSVGFRLPYTQVDVRRRNPDGSLGEVCAAREIGVLTVRGPTVSRGYKNAQQNRGVFIDGTLNSGDLAYTDASGRIYIAGRAKDLIIRSGHNIDPLLIESAMTSHPAVAMAAAVSQPDSYAGELPVCYVSLRPGAEVNEAQLHAHAEKHIAERPAWPKHIYIVPALPVTGVGKVFKPQLRADAAKRLVQRIVFEELKLSEARVDAAEGGVRGMRVTVTLPKALAHVASAVEEKLAAYVFESVVTVE